MTGSSKRLVSQPLLSMLQAGSVAPIAVHTAIAGQTAKYGYPVLRANHPYVRSVRNATSLNVTEIASRYGRLLVSIEQIMDGRITWFYREFKSTYCSFRYPAQLSDTILAALPGRPLRAVTDGIKPLVDVTIAGEDEQYASAGWLALKLTPRWIAF